MALAVEAKNEKVGAAVKSKLLMNPDGSLRVSRPLYSRTSD